MLIRVDRQAIDTTQGQGVLLTGKSASEGRAPDHRRHRRTSGCINDRNHLAQIMANVQAYVWPSMGATQEAVIAGFRAKPGAVREVLRAVEWHGPRRFCALRPARQGLHVAQRRSSAAAEPHQPFSL